MSEATFGTKIDRGWARRAPPKFWDPYLFLQQFQLGTSNLVYNLGSWSSVAKTTFGTKIGGGPGQGAPQKIWDPLFLQQLKLWTSNLVYKFGSWSSVAKNNFQDQNQWGLGWGALLQILGPPTYFCNNFSQGLQIWYITWGHEVVLPKTTFTTKIDRAQKIVTLNMVHNLGLWSSVAKNKFQYQP